MQDEQPHPELSLQARALLALVRFYQYALSPLMGRSCRFYPSCSSYTATAVRRFGAGRGAWLGIARIFRCHPFSCGGVDPVPENWQNPAAKLFAKTPPCCDKNTCRHSQDTRI